MATSWLQKKSRINKALSVLREIKFAFVKFPRNNLQSPRLVV